LNYRCGFALPEVHFTPSDTAWCSGADSINAKSGAAGNLLHLTASRLFHS